MSVWSKILTCVVLVLCFVYDIRFAPVHIMNKVKMKKANFSYLLYVFIFRFFQVTAYSLQSPPHREASAE